ncbi:creatininase [Bdellovibrio bacteriovorus W]|nr:creatininase [Bdellovibrio bacteriovorus W]
MNLQEMSWPQVEAYLKEKQTIIVPVGSTEQHGPNGLIGIDYMAAWHIAQAAGLQSKILVAPPLCFGMAVHHMAFAGTMSLSPSTYVLVLTELIQGLMKHGFKRILFVNGHGGNIAPITTAFCQAQMDNERVDLQLINWWHLPEVREYEEKVFGDENGFHATCGEISVTMYTHPEAYAKMPSMDFQPTVAKHQWPMSPQLFRETFPDGRMGSNPSLSSSKHGEVLFNLAVNAISRRLEVK